MGFICWVFSHRAPNWVSGTAIGITLGLCLAAWVAFLHLAPGWLIAGVLSVIVAGGISRAYRIYRADKAEKGSG